MHKFCVDVTAQWKLALFQQLFLSPATRGCSPFAIFPKFCIKQVKKHTLFDFILYSLPRDPKAFQHFTRAQELDIYLRETCLWYRFCNKHLPSSHHPIFYCLVSDSTCNHIQRLMLQPVAYRFCKLVKSILESSDSYGLHASYEP